ncbi:MAG: oligosaccharide flippase family protein [Actinomycetia bacterium]|nr:oligosaccharide flippase family protein [Actinomycetes bacterium]
MNLPDRRTLARRTALITLGQGAVKASQLIAAVVLVRLLSPESWTKVALVLSIYLAATTLGAMNLQHGIIYFLPRVETHQQRALVLQTAGVIATCGVLIAVGLAVAAPWVGGSTFEARTWLPLLGLAIAIELPSVCVPAAFIATDRLGLAAAWDIAMTVVLLTCLVLPAVMGYGVAAIVIGLLVSAIVRLLAFGCVMFTFFSGRPKGLPKGTLVAQLKFALPLGLTIAASVLNRTVDKWLVAWMHPERLGVYTVAAQEIPLLAVLPYAGGAAVVTLVVEAFHRGDLEFARQAWLRQTAAMSLVVVPLSMGLIVVGREVIGLAFTGDYLAGVLPFQLFTAITLHRVAEYGLVLRAAGRGRALVRSAVVLLTANLVLAGIGAALGGMVGASIGTLTANALAWWYVLGQVADAFDSSRRESFAWATWFGAIAAALIAAVVASVLGTVLADTTLSMLVVKGCVFAVTYVGLIRVASVGRVIESLRLRYRDVVRHREVEGALTS